MMTYKALAVLTKYVCMDECWIIDDSAEAYHRQPADDFKIYGLKELSPWEYDEEGFGEMPVECFRSALHASDFRACILTHGGHYALQRLECRKDEARAMTYQEFLDLLSNKRRRSMQLALFSRDKQRLPLKSASSVKGHLLHHIAHDFLPDAADRKFYEDQYSCSPPPVFILFISLIELASFIYYSVVSGEIFANGPVPLESVFIYRPDKRLELWRFIMYIVVHAGWVHLSFNLVVQMLVGLPLEMVHGSIPVAFIYFSGVFAGSLGTSIFDKEVCLVGASGGVYALLAAHVANVLLNYSLMQCGLFRVFCVFLIASTDVAFAIWSRYAMSADPTVQPTSYVAHLAGSLAGLTVGLVVLKNFSQKLCHQCIWWTALALYCTFVVFAIVWNVVVY